MFSLFFRRTQSALIILSFSLYTNIGFAQERQDSPAPESNTGSTMTFEKMTEIIEKYAGETKSTANTLTFNYNDVTLTLIADARANRMRIVTPVINADQLTTEELIAITVSNFHLALDARYAIGGNVLYSVFIHPLRELSAEQIESAIRQVSTLRVTYGSEFSSGELNFGIQKSRGQAI